MAENSPETDLLNKAGKKITGPTGEQFTIYPADDSIHQTYQEIQIKQARTEGDGTTFKAKSFIDQSKGMREANRKANRLLRSRR